MLLVLIALSVGTVLAAAALTSRDNSPAIGENASLKAAASWAAEAGADVAKSVLETTIAWRTTANGVLLDDYPILGSRVDAVVTNLNGDPPTPRDRELILRATAVVDPISTTVERRVSLALPTTIFQPVDPFFGEFAVFANSSMLVSADSTVRADPLSPERSSSVPIKLGMGFSAAADMLVDPLARLRNVELVVDQGGSLALEQIASAQPNAAGSTRVPMDVPAHSVTLPSQLQSLPVILTKDLDVRNVTGDDDNNNWIYGPSQTLVSGGWYKKVKVADSGVLTIDAANGNRYSFDDLIIDNNSVVVIKGRVMLHVRDDLLVTNGSTIELADAGSSFAVYVGDDLLVSDSAIGVPRAIGRNRSRDFEDRAAYMRPHRVRVMMLDSVPNGQMWTAELRSNALMVGSIHGPHTPVTIRTSSTLAGQVVANRFRLESASTLLYDPRLDSRAGFSWIEGPVYEAGQPINGLVNAINSAGSLDPATNLAKLINRKLSERWATSTDWRVRQTDPSASDLKTYYEGFKTFDGLDPAGPPVAGGGTAPPTGGVLGVGATASVQPVQVTSPISAALLLEQDVLNTGQSPSRRTFGRVISHRIPSAVLAMEGGG